MQSRLVVTRQGTRDNSRLRRRLVLYKCAEATPTLGTGLFRDCLSSRKIRAQGHDGEEQHRRSDLTQTSDLGGVHLQLQRTTKTKPHASFHFESGSSRKETTLRDAGPGVRIALALGGLKISQEGWVWRPLRRCRKVCGGLGRDPATLNSCLD